MIAKRSGRAWKGCSGKWPRRKPWAQQKVQLQRDQLSLLQESIRKVRNAKALAAQLDRQTRLPLCGNTAPFPERCLSDPHKPKKEFERIYDSLTTQIQQFSASVAHFQEEHRPIFDRIYVHTRKLLFDFFGTSIDVF